MKIESLLQSNNLEIDFTGCGGGSVLWSLEMCFLFLSINFFHLCCCMMNFYFISVQAFYHTINYFLEDNKLAAIYVMLELNGIYREIIFPRQSLGYSEYKNEKCLLLIVLSTIQIDICPTFIVTPHFTEECLCLSS